MHVTAGMVIWTILVGLAIGVLGRIIAPGRQNIGIFLTIVVGIVASFIGLLIARALHVADTPGIDWIELGIQAVVAAVGVALIGGTGRRSRV
jgi:uncharacterized membrane protein YeaQ/YmgE (transglycosylase-associated protein family)